MELAPASGATSVPYIDRDVASPLQPG